MDRDIPEYYYLFGRPDEGELQVKVKLEKSKSWVLETSMNYNDFHKLINRKTGRLHDLMRFDDHPFPIRRYEFDPEKNTMCIVCKGRDQLSQDQIKNLTEESSS